jgi:hypothetical protein
MSTTRRFGRSLKRFRREVVEDLRQVLAADVVGLVALDLTSLTIRARAGTEPEPGRVRSASVDRDRSRSRSETLACALPRLSLVGQQLDVGARGEQVCVQLDSGRRRSFGRVRGAMVLGDVFVHAAQRNADVRLAAYFDEAHECLPQPVAAAFAERQLDERIFRERIAQLRHELLEGRHSQSSKPVAWHEAMSALA